VSLEKCIIVFDNGDKKRVQLATEKANGFIEENRIKEVENWDGIRLIIDFGKVREIQTPLKDLRREEIRDSYLNNIKSQESEKTEQEYKKDLHEYEKKASDDIDRRGQNES